MTEDTNTKKQATKAQAATPDTPIRSVKVAIIGAGTAGHNAYRQVSQATDSLVIINEGIWSTTCTTMGCMPSKLLIAAGERAHHANHSADFGIEGEATINAKQVMQRVRRERDHFASYPLKNAQQWDDKHKIFGRAIVNEDGLIEAHKATGETELIQAEHIIIATGSTPNVPDGWMENLGELLITSDTIFELPELPKSIAVVGAGAIGLELAQAMCRLGVEVTVFNRTDRIAGLKDDTINTKAIECLSAELDFKLKVDINEVRKQSASDGSNIDNKEDAVAVIDYTDEDGAKHTWQGQLLLAATGRRNSIKEMGIENLGVKLDDKNRPQNIDTTSGKIDNLNVYIVGDANAYMPILHVSSNEGYLAGKEVALIISGKANNSNVDQKISEAIDGDPDCAADASTLNDITPAKAKKAATPMTVTFSDPQIANVGQSLNEIKKANIEHVIGEVSFDNQGRSRIMGVNCGVLRLYTCAKTGAILGASMVAPAAEYIAHILATAIENEITVDGLLESPFYHPTILEGLRTALRDARDKITANQSNDKSAR